MFIARKILKIAGTLLGLVVLLVLGLFLVLTVFEYKPKEEETLAIEGNSDRQVSLGESLHMMTWNLGYGALGEEADFFMDGGQNVSYSSLEDVKSNMAAINDTISRENPDLLLLQEVDVDSKRSHGVNELESVSGGLDTYQYSFAYNYKVLYVPYPIPDTIGKVNCGIASFSRYNVDSSERISLPCPFSYPLRLCNLKRCLLVDRLPIEGSDKELVIINLHLEAYDSGEGKIAQTRQLKELLDKEYQAGNYVIAAGDFNQTFSNADTEAYPILNDQMWTPGIVDVDDFDNYTFYMDTSTPSCRSLDRPYAGADQDNFQYYMLDGYIVSDNIDVEKIETKDLGFVNSDHNPVILDFSLK